MAAKTTPKKMTPKKRKYTQAPVTIDKGIPCVHCGGRFDHRVSNTYPNGRRRMICAACGLPFVVWRDTHK